MVLDGIAASEAIDSSGEILDVDGCDISSLEEGQGVLNWEHRGEDSPGSGPGDVVGKIVYARKIMKRTDAEDDRQQMYWDMIRLPYVYIIARLFDGSGHKNAAELAAIIRDYKANGEPILVRYSIEGSTLEKDGNKLKRSVARRVAATIKPCNRSCHSDVLEDPNNPQGSKKYDDEPKDVLEEAAKSELPHPNYTRLGGSYEVECDPEIGDELSLTRAMLKLKLLKKAIAAGVPSAAPSQLTQGEALQREDSSWHKTKNQAMAALRDFGKPFDKDKFKKFIKTKLPEASDGFVDHFVDLADDYHVKLKKAEDDDLAKREATAPTMKKPPRQQIRSAIDEPDEDDENMEPQRLGVTQPATRMGKPIPPNPNVFEPVLDEKKGVLHTPAGSFPLYDPGKDKKHGEAFKYLINDPRVGEFHDEAMKNWVKVHEKLKQGRLPPEIVMHSVLFSMLSPNTPVPMQELMYSRLIDSMKATGHDPRDPDFGKIYDHWKQSDSPTELPQHSRDFFQNNPGVHLKQDSKFNQRQAGDIASMMLPSNKMKNMAQYHLLHDSLIDLVNRHRHDARSAVAEMMNHKRQKQNWDNVRGTKLREAGVDIGPYTGPAVPGLKQKTGRYMYGMMGGGNVLVPDTHMSRYLFGLDKNLDADTIAYLRNTLWRPTASHILGGIDRWYSKTPAVEHMVTHPRWGKHFANREDAIFPAFWKNWIVINPHERERGMRTGSYTEGTTHRPFWEAVDPFMKKSEAEDRMLPLQTARLHHEYVQKYGEVPAQMLYYRFIVPKLLAAAEAREKMGYSKSVWALERLCVDLKKTLAEAAAPEPKSSVIDADKHVVPHLAVKPEQRDLIHGSDTSKWEMGYRPEHAGHGQAFTNWVKAGAKGTVAVQKFDPDSGWGGLPAAHSETAYHNLAHDFFGLGQHVPTSVTFRHPVHGHLMSLHESIPNAEHVEDGAGRFIPAHQRAILKTLGSNGSLHKLAIMNWVLGNVDRHSGNYLMSKDAPYLHLIDHGHTFTPESDRIGMPAYLRHYASVEGVDPSRLPVDEDVQKWLAGLDRKKLGELMQSYQMPKNTQADAQFRLGFMQDRAKQLGRKLTVGQLLEAAGMRL